MKIKKLKQKENSLETCKWAIQISHFKKLFLETPLIKNLACLLVLLAVLLLLSGCLTLQPSPYSAQSSPALTSSPLFPLNNSKKSVFSGDSLKCPSIVELPHRSQQGTSPLFQSPLWELSSGSISRRAGKDKAKSLWQR